jgi:hypothetical protein
MNAHWSEIVRQGAQICADVLPMLGIILLVTNLYLASLKVKQLKRLEASRHPVEASIAPQKNLVGKSQVEPPIFAELLVAMFAKRRYRAAILQDLAEDFERDIGSGMSIGRARARYIGAVFNSIGPQALAAIKRLGVIGIIYDYARRWIS